MDFMVKNEKNICIIGKGSIGIRHGQIFKSLGYNIFFYREKRKKPKVKINFQYKEIFKLKDIKNKKFILFVIANPSSKHVKTLIKIIFKNLNVLVEKPLASTNLDLDKMKKLYEKFKINLFPGYQLRFDPRIKMMKKIIKKKQKKLRYANFHLKTFLPDWHPWEDFRDSYASQKKLGGGVLLTCSHEIDLAINFFGEAQSVFCVKTNSRLKTNNVENSIILIIKHKKNGVISNINLDYSYKNKEDRFIEIIFEDEEIKCNLNKKNLLIQKNYISKTIKPKLSVNRNSIFKRQNLDILKKIKNKKYKSPTFKAISQAEKIVFAAKKSILSRKFEHVN